MCEVVGLGRSAYICREDKCIESGLSKERLARALKSTVTEAQRAELKEELVCKLR